MRSAQSCAVASSTLIGTVSRTAGSLAEFLMVLNNDRRRFFAVLHHEDQFDYAGQHCGVDAHGGSR